MFPSFIVTFREILEVAIILGVVLAATKGLAGRNKWIYLGIALGIAGSGVVAAFTGAISDFAEGIGQELFNAAILFTASLIIAWTALWMNKNARNMVSEIKNKSGKIVEGQLPKFTLSAIIALAVLREGAEIVLFTYGMIASGQSLTNIALGSAAGLTSGAALGALLYFGLVSIPTKYVFKITTYLLMFLSAGMASVGAKYLVAAGYFDNLSATVVDMSSLLSENSIAGQVLHSMFGYSERPMQIQVLFYLATIIIFLVASKFSGKNKPIPTLAAIGVSTLLVCYGFYGVMA